MSVYTPTGTAVPVKETGIRGVRDEVVTVDETVAFLLKCILEELKINNAQLSKITGELITRDEIQRDDF